MAGASRTLVPESFLIGEVKSSEGVAGSEPPGMTGLSMISDKWKGLNLKELEVKRWSKCGQEGGGTVKVPPRGRFYTSESPITCWRAPSYRLFWILLPGV